MKKLFIIEDNDKDFQNIYNLISGNFKDLEIYPKSLLENSELRKNIKALFSALDRKSVPARKFLNDLKINEFDGLILDYELYPSIKLVTGVELYKELKLNVKTLILTKYVGRGFDVINEIINKEGFSDKMLVKQKGHLVILSEEQKEEHINNINQHIFEEQVCEQSQLKLKILEKLNNNKPKLNAATDEINKNIYRVTDELILKINQQNITLTNSLLNSLEFESEVKYFQILNNLNS